MKIEKKDGGLVAIKIEKHEECEACEGTGKDYYSCCGDDMRGSDDGLCPSCYEHTGIDAHNEPSEDCSECNGTGKG